MNKKAKMSRCIKFNYIKQTYLAKQTNKFLYGFGFFLKTNTLSCVLGDALVTRKKCLQSEVFKRTQ